jgi:Ca2+-binding EF-hand superfamily protein
MSAKDIFIFWGTVALTMTIGISMTAAHDGSSDFIERFDQNGDGVITIEEFTGPERHFDRLDSNGDGAIDGDETPQGPPHGPPPSPEEMLAEFDEDGDGLLSLSEFPGPDDHFELMDSDGDGAISSEELADGRPGPRHSRRSKDQ